MRSLPCLLAASVVLFSGCVHLRIAPPDAQLLTQKPVIGIQQLPPAAPDVELHARGLVGVITAVTTAVSTEPLSKPVAPSGTVPQLVGNWVRQPAPPEHGPLFDSTDVLAAAMLGNLQRAFLADPQSRVCMYPQDCQGVGLILRVAITGTGFSNSHVTVAPRMRYFTTRAQLATPDGRILWEGSCAADAQAISASAPMMPTSAQYLQKLLDDGAWQCGDWMGNLLQANVSTSMQHLNDH